MRTDRTLQWIARVVLSAAAIACPLDAQTAAETSRTGAATFLDRRLPDEARLEALRRLTAVDDSLVPSLLNIGADRKQSDAIRLAAFGLVPYSEKYVDIVLKILGDPNDGGELLDAGLIENLAERTLRVPPRIAVRIQNVLRELLTDRRDQVRLYAYRFLIANHDEVALSLLTESLRRQRGVPVPLPEALDLLDQDGSASHIGTLRPYLEHSDPKVQAEAARALAVDPQSRPKIVELVTNPEAAEEVRLQALRGLAREDARFAAYAIPIVENPHEDGDVRYAAMHAFVGRMNYNRVETQDQIRFAEAVAKVAADPGLRSEKAASIREAAKELHLYLKKAFPEVQRFYDRR